MTMTVAPQPPQPSFESELRELINRRCRENESGTPDYILAEYMLGCLQTFEAATQARDAWYGLNTVRQMQGWGKGL